MGIPLSRLRYVEPPPIEKINISKPKHKNQTALLRNALNEATNGENSSAKTSRIPGAPPGRG